MYVRFLEEIDDLKNHFAINWPLNNKKMSLICACTFAWQSAKKKSEFRVSKNISKPTQIQNPYLKYQVYHTKAVLNFKNLLEEEVSTSFHRIFCGSIIIKSCPRAIKIKILHSNWNIFSIIYSKNSKITCSQRTINLLTILDFFEDWKNSASLYF